MNLKIFCLAPPEIFSSFFITKAKIASVLISTFLVLVSDFERWFKKESQRSTNNFFDFSLASSLRFGLFTKKYSIVLRAPLYKLKCSSAFSRLLKAPLIAKTKGKIIAILISVKSMLYTILNL